MATQAGAADRGGQELRRPPARDVKVCQQPLVHLASQWRQGAGNVLVGEHPDDGKRAGKETHLAEIVGKTSHRLWIMCHVEDDGRSARKNLKTPRQAKLDQPPSYRLHRHRQPLPEQLDDGERDRCIAQLVRAAQTRIRQATTPQPVPTPEGPLLLVAKITEITAQQV